MIWDFLINRVPWGLQVAVLAIIALVVLYLLVRIFGFERVKGWIGPVLAVIGAVGLLQRSRQQGYADRVAQEDAAQQRANDVVVKEREDVRKLPDAELDRRLDRWSKS